jgi:xanthine dehydrogenase YagS FAD-binding subunit
MFPLAYSAAANLKSAIARATRLSRAEFIAGGTDMVQLLQDGVRAPEELIDLNGLPLSEIAVTSDGVRIGALARMAQVASDSRVRRRFPAVAQALMASASPQIRNMASIGGNLLQRTRCLYFRDTVTPCNKREPGSGCSALDGENRLNAVLGGSAQCIAAYPGDLAIALLALDAEVEIAGQNGERRIALETLHREPDDAPHIDTTLRPGDIITAVFIPESEFAQRSCFVKIRDRASFEWALASAAAALSIERGRVRQARVAVGGVATKPWRLRHVEDSLISHNFHLDRIRQAAALAADGAQPRSRNGFKVELLKRVVERALRQAGENS